MKKGSTSLLLIAFFISFLFVGASFRLVLAQSNTNWAPQQRIPGYDNDTWPPILIADQNRTVHAFSSQWLNISESHDVRAIVYNRWIQGQGWTRPIDIIFSPLKNDARLLDARLDQRGIVHIIFWGGDNTEANIYYSNASVAEAGNANVWSSPILVAENAGDPEAGNFVVAEDGHISLLYSGHDRNGVYSTISDDNGVTWVKPTSIYLTNDQYKMPQALSMYMGQSGWIHAIWNEITINGQGRGIYYSKKKIDDLNWSAPVKLAEAETGLGTLTPAIIEYHGTVLALYNLDVKIWQRSYDGEKDWTPPARIFNQHVGANGSLSLVVDGNDELHIFFGQRIPGSPDIHGMWHSIFSGFGWLEPEAVVSGPVIRDQIGNSGFDPYQARAAISQGNTFLVTWRSDPAAGDNGIWFSDKVIDAPELPLVAPGTVLPTGQINSYPTEPPQILESTPTSGSVAATNAPDSLIKSSLNNNPSNALFIAIVPVFLLISTIIILSFQARNKRN